VSPPRFTREQLEAFAGAAVPDLIGDGVKLLVAGINPGLWTAATGTHFAHPGNRFYPALHRAELIDREIDRSLGFTESDREHLMARGIAITNLVNRATVRADQLGADELRAGAARLETLAAAVRPVVVAVAGITAYRTAFGRRTAALGRQPERIADSELWVVPNPSGLNAHDTIDTLAGWFHRVGEAAGIAPPGRPGRSPDPGLRSTTPSRPRR
jgi:TDG/mug DNA glycosylase family protein